MKILNMRTEARVSIKISICDYFLLLYYVNCWGLMPTVDLFTNAPNFQQLWVANNTHKGKKRASKQ